MGVTCQILIDRTEHGVFKAGGSVTGSLKYFIDKPTQFRRISMCFLGKGECQWSNSDSDSDDDGRDYKVPVVVGSRKHEFLVPAAIYSQYQEEPPSYSSIPARDVCFVIKENDEEGFSKYEKSDSNKNEKQGLNENDDPDNKGNILLDPTENGIYRAGGLVTGTLKYFIDKPTQYRRISMVLIGKGKCIWTEHSNRSTRNRARTTNTIYYTNNEDHTNQMTNINLGKEQFISGAFEYPFQFQLPINIPPSFKDQICTIEYKLTVSFLKTNSMTPQREFDVEIPVTSYVMSFSLEPLRKREEVVRNTTTKTAVAAKSVSNLICVVPTYHNLCSIQHSRILIGEYKVRIKIEVPWPHRDESLDIPVVIGPKMPEYAAAVAVVY
ncbi:hypothetical protein HW555_001446 [Spodoptera exigua]|uniref:Arrestin-like N-terminal domain-containing protein n=1 Tax=Spodoptera exigua TaxID=7107 RepID=A0A835GSX8_SPOEX|nr:hypothetical protein HW555_001446 [Spodoptera exigua]